MVLLDTLALILAFYAVFYFMLVIGFPTHTTRWRRLRGGGGSMWLEGHAIPKREEIKGTAPRGGL
jgi:hypothetical protein